IGGIGNQIRMHKIETVSLVGQILATMANPRTRHDTPDSHRDRRQQPISLANTDDRHVLPDIVGVFLSSRREYVTLHIRDRKLVTPLDAGVPASARAAEAG